MKKTKKGQAIVETIVVLGLYFFMIGFLLSSFQVMYNKSVLTVAAYEAARTAAVYESSEAYSGSFNGVIKAYNAEVAEENAKHVIDEIALARKLITLNSVEIKSTNDFKQMSNKVGKDLYIIATLKGKMGYLFPLISPNMDNLIANDVDFEVSFTIPKERIWNT